MTAMTRPGDARGRFPRRRASVGDLVDSLPGASTVAAATSPSTWVPSEARVFDGTQRGIALRAATWTASRAAALVLRWLVAPTTTTATISTSAKSLATTAGTVETPSSGSSAPLLGLRSNLTWLHSATRNVLSLLASGSHTAPPWSSVVNEEPRRPDQVLATPDATRRATATPRDLDRLPTPVTPFRSHPSVVEEGDEADEGGEGDVPVGDEEPPSAHQARELSSSETGEPAAVLSTSGVPVRGSDEGASATTPVWESRPDSAVENAVQAAEPPAAPLPSVTSTPATPSRVASSIVFVHPAPKRTSGRTMRTVAIAVACVATLLGFFAGSLLSTDERTDVLNIPDMIVVHDASFSTVSSFSSLEQTEGDIEPTPDDVSTTMNAVVEVMASTSEDIVALGESTDHPAIDSDPIAIEAASSSLRFQASFPPFRASTPIDIHTWTGCLVSSDCHDASPSTVNPSTVRLQTLQHLQSTQRAIRSVVRVASVAPAPLPSDPKPIDAAIDTLMLASGSVVPPSHLLEPTSSSVDAQQPVDVVVEVGSSPTSAVIDLDVEVPSTETRSLASHPVFVLPPLDSVFALSLVSLAVLMGIVSSLFHAAQPLTPVPSVSVVDETNGEIVGETVACKSSAAVPSESFGVEDEGFASDGFTNDGPMPDSALVTDVLPTENSAPHTLPSPPATAPFVAEGTTLSTAPSPVTHLPWAAVARRLVMTPHAGASGSETEVPEGFANLPNIGMIRLPNPFVGDEAAVARRGVSGNPASAMRTGTRQRRTVRFDEAGHWDAEAGSVFSSVTAASSSAAAVTTTTTAATATAAVTCSPTSASATSADHSLDDTEPSASVAEEGVDAVRGAPTPAHSARRAGARAGRTPGGPSVGAMADTMGAAAGGTYFALRLTQAHRGAPIEATPVRRSRRIRADHNAAAAAATTEGAPSSSSSSSSSAAPSAATSKVGATRKRGGVASKAVKETDISDGEGQTAASRGGGRARRTTTTEPDSSPAKKAKVDGAHGRKAAAPAVTAKTASTRQRVGRSTTTGAAAARGVGNVLSLVSVGADGRLELEAEASGLVVNEAW